MKINYHTHTPRCRHANGTDREYVESAISAGVKIIGFSDHGPYCFSDGYYSNFRMLPEETGGYVESLTKLREEYKKDVKIYIGYELEYYPAYFDDTMKLIDRFGYDYIIQAQHFCKNEAGEQPSAYPTDDESRLKRYVSQTIEGMNTGRYFYLAHPDLIRFTGSDRIYDKHMRKLCKAAKKIGMPLEINLLGVYDGRFYPHEQFWHIAAEEGCEAIIGLDAHSPAHFGREEAYEKALALAERCGIKVIEPEAPVKFRPPLV